MNNISITIDERTLEKMKKFYDSQKIEQDDPQKIFVAKTIGCTISVYHTLKVLFQGTNAIHEAKVWQHDLPLDISEQHHINEVSHIGSDEVGTGDYFGPVCVVACYVDEKDIPWLTNLGIRDSKALSDSQIVSLARQIKDRLVYSLLILDNPHYNHMINKGINQANIKAKLHNQAITNVIQKLAINVHLKVVDQFVSPKTYYNYLKNEVIVVKDLHFETKAEDKYLAVACASILARYAFIQYFNNMSRTLKIELPKGASHQVDMVASQLVLKYGEKILDKIAKVHFSNTKKVRELIKDSTVIHKN